LHHRSRAYFVLGISTPKLVTAGIHPTTGCNISSCRTPPHLKLSGNGTRQYFRLSIHPIMLLFGLGGLLTSAVLLINAIAILSEDRFLARIGWTNTLEPGFGGARDDASIKARLINLVSSVRTLMRIPLMFINTFMIIYYLVLG